MQQKTRARRRAAVSVGLAAAALIALAGVRLASGGDDPPTDLARIGVPLAQARCSPEVREPAAGDGDHVDGKATYGALPPSFGAHHRTPVTVNDRGFYTTRDTPEVEQLVHNLEHGYTVLWYDPFLDDAELDELEALSEALRADARYRKFIAAPWDITRGELPDATPVALTHWGVSEGFRQFCGKVSGPAVAAFMDAHPASDSPEPNSP